MVQVVMHANKATRLECIRPYFMQSQIGLKKQVVLQYWLGLLNNAVTQLVTNAKSLKVIRSNGR